MNRLESTVGGETDREAKSGGESTVDRERGREGDGEVTTRMKEFFLQIGEMMGGGEGEGGREGVRGWEWHVPSRKREQVTEEERNRSTLGQQSRSTDIQNQKKQNIVCAAITSRIVEQSRHLRKIVKLKAFIVRMRSTSPQPLHSKKKSAEFSMVHWCRFTVLFNVCTLPQSPNRFHNVLTFLSLGRHFLPCFS